MGTIEVEDELDEDETIALARAWKQAHQGISRANLPAVLSGGAKFNPITINPRDSQFLESRQYSQGEIAGMIFRVPPHMIGIIDRSTSWGTGIAQQEQGYVTNTLGGYLGRLEEALTALMPAGQVVKFNVNARLRGDKLQRYQAYSLGTLGGWLSADDVRADEDMPPLPDGQGGNYMIPVNSELLAQALKNLQQPPDDEPPAAAPARK
jgi:HK97 family phage portal protein